MSKIITVEWNQVSVEDRNNSNVEHCCHVFTRQEFEKIIGCSLEKYQSVSYEPNRNIFITVNKENKISSFQKADEEPLLKIIDEKINEIIFETEKVLLINKDYILTPEYKIQEAKNELASLDWINSKYTREVQVLKNLTDEEYHLKYQTEYTRMVELVTLINELELQLGGN